MQLHDGFHAWSLAPLNRRSARLSRPHQGSAIMQHGTVVDERLVERHGEHAASMAARMPWRPGV